MISKDTTAFKRGSLNSVEITEFLLVEFLKGCANKEKASYYYLVPES